MNKATSGRYSREKYAGSIGPLKICSTFNAHSRHSFFAFVLSTETLVPNSLSD